MNQFDAVAHSPDTGVKSVATKGPDVDQRGNTQMQKVDTGNNWDAMVSYDGFEADNNLVPFTSLSCCKQSDHDEDVVTVRSPILCKPGNPTPRDATVSPTSISAHAFDSRDMKALAPSWTISEFQEYMAMLELLQDECNNSKDSAICLSVERLGHMERLLTLLLPQQSLS